MDAPCFSLRRDALAAAQQPAQKAPPQAGTRYALRTLAAQRRAFVLRPQEGQVESWSASRLWSSLLCSGDAAAQQSQRLQATGPMPLA